MRHWVIIIFITVCCSLKLLDAATPAGNELTPLETSVQPFYKLTEKFLDFLQPADRSIVLTDIVTVSANVSLMYGYLTDWRQTSQRYALSVLGYVILITFGVIFIVALPLTGCIVCCCRCCCGKCGGRIRPMERKGAKCRRVVYGCVLTLLTTLMLCGVVLAFISNQLVHNALDHSRPDNVPRRLASGLSGAAAELAAVPRAARNRSAQVVSDTAAKLDPALRDALAAMRSSLLAESGLRQVLGQTARCLSGLRNARQLGKDLTTGWGLVSSSGAEFNASLAELRSAVSRDCSANSLGSGCSWLSDRLDSLYPNDRPHWAESQVSGGGACVGVASPELDNSPALAGDSQLAAMLRGPSPPSDNFVEIAMSALAGELEAAKSRLNSTAEIDRIWGAAERFTGSISAMLSNASACIDSSVINPTNNAEQSVAYVITGFDLFRYYFYIGLACLALLIVAFFYLGLAFGFCGEPPYEDSRCCNKGVGANLLLAGTGFAFLFGWLIMLFVMTFFVTGAVLDTEVCRHLTGRSGPVGYRALDNAASALLRRTNPDLARYTNGLFAGLLGECADAAAAGRSTSLASALNLTELVRASDLRLRVVAYADLASDALRRDWGRIAADGLASADSLAGNISALSGLVSAAGGKAGANAAACAAAMERPLMRNGNLDSSSLLAAVKQVAAEAGTAGPPELRDRWSALAEKLPAALGSAAGAVARQRELAVQLSATLADVSTSGQNLTARVSAAAWAALRDPRVFNASLAVARGSLTDALAVVISNAVAGVLNWAADCAAIGGHLSKAVRAPCVQLLQPFNGYWSGLGAFLIFLLPALIVACKLANLYRKTSKYEKDYQEPDYMAYQGFYPTDTVPLDGQAKPKRRKTSSSKEKSRVTSQQLSASGSGGGVGPSSAQRDTAVVAINRQSQRYSQVPAYAQEAYDY